MEQRERFIRDQQNGLYTMTEVCDRHTISRKTGYKWLERFDAGGRAALSDRSRAPHRCPHRISDDIAELICTARRQDPSWGPEKRLQWLTPRHRDVALPAISTAGDLLARPGLVKKRPRRRPQQHPGVVPATTRAPE
jgi:transposase